MASPRSASSVTVVMPVRNGAPWLPRALAALAEQTHPDVDVVIVDDGSTDQTPALLRAWAAGEVDTAAGPHRRVLTHDHPRGAAEARRSGLAAATGTWVWFTDVDDQWSPDLLAVVVAAGEAYDADLVAWRMRRVERSGRTWVMEGVDQATVLEAVDLPSAVLDGRLRGHLPNKLLRRACVRMPEPPLPATQEDFLVVLATLAALRRAVLVPQILYTYLEQPGDRGGPAEIAAMEHVATRADELSGAVEPGLRRFFRCWFWAVPAVTSTVTAAGSWSVAQATALRRRVRAELGLGDARICWNYDRRIAVWVALIVVTGPLFGPLYRVSRRAQAGASHARSALGR